MKYLAIIFSLYFVLLAVLPCQDRDDMIAGVIHQTIQKGHSANDERGQETCPPFCTCSCCSTAKTLTTTITTAVFTRSVTREYPGYSIPAVQEQPIKIWQPPQIA
ncbi:hypothetical protein KXD93_09160 [Mucilaginibacter sp. BJC16-A38]|uniref:DUF6660 family protein n=1 Tax=Mucilaginibacter phenanthrenivorans TaxID=1234842 RepID=UPI002157D4FB|nr:DUF6660 family protein [Mucilaginibacter phenanthrenivorans]MCR8557809.1 hypothetical protein [Mucilaginibacter phenanthrenivorans]